MQTAEWINLGLLIAALISIYYTVRIAVKKGHTDAIKTAVTEAVKSTQEYDTLKSEVDLVKLQVKMLGNHNSKELGEIKTILKDLGKRIDAHIDKSHKE